MDHDRLRGLLAELVRSTTHALRDEKAIHEAREALCAVADAFETHIADLQSVDALHHEHAEQLALIRAMRDDARVGVRPTSELADEIAWFTRSLERGMEREERILGAQR
jgi:hypothetical protein